MNVTDADIKRAKRVVADIEQQNEIEYGAATNWCPELALEAIATALAQEREAILQDIEAEANVLQDYDAPYLAKVICARHRKDQP